MEINTDYEEYSSRGITMWPTSHTADSLAYLLKGYPMEGWGRFNQFVKPMGGIKGEVSVSASWGDKEGTKVSVGGMEKQR